MWSLDLKWATPSKFKKYRSKHPDEYASCFANLDKIIRLLDAGNKIGGFSVGFFRSEGNELYRIGQSGVKSAKETRLYVYPDSSDSTMYVLGVGAKETQAKDIADLNKQITEIRKSKET